MRRSGRTSHAHSPTNMGTAAGNEFNVGQHEASHHNSEAERMLYFARMQTYFMGKYAQVLSRLKAISEGDKTLLYNTISLAFSELGDPNHHETSKVGVLLAGQAGGRLQTGQAIDAMARPQGLHSVTSPNDAERRKREAAGRGGDNMVQGVSYNHVLVTVAQAMGLTDNTFGNSAWGQGPVPGLLKDA